MPVTIQIGSIWCEISITDATMTCDHGYDGKGDEWECDDICEFAVYNHDTKRTVEINHKYYIDTIYEMLDADQFGVLWNNYLEGERE